MAKAAERVYSLIKEAVCDQGVKLWDVVFVKEGASYYLRVFIDKEEGVGIDDCVNVSHAIDPIIDEADPIDQSYCLEVCSPGIERELSREEHFSYAVGSRIKVKLFKAIDGKKELSGVLSSFEKNVLTLRLDDGEMELDRFGIAKANIIEN